MFNSPIEVRPIVETGYYDVYGTVDTETRVEHANGDMFDNRRENVSIAGEDAPQEGLSIAVHICPDCRNGNRVGWMARAVLDLPPIPCVTCLPPEGVETAVPEALSEALWALLSEDAEKRRR